MAKNSFSAGHSSRSSLAVAETKPGSAAAHSFTQDGINALLIDPPELRYTLAAIIAFAPVFFANLVFSYSFRDTKTADIGWDKASSTVYVPTFFKNTIIAFKVE